MDESMAQRLALAARDRSAGVATRADRPSQRRSASMVGARPVVTSRASLQLRAADGAGAGLHFTGAASTYEDPYEMWDFYGPYSEIVSAGAGAKSLARPDLDVPLVLQHDPLRRIARTTNGTLTLVEDDHGLIVDAPNLDPNDRDVAYIEPKLRSGLVDEMSFMFRITRGQWSPDYTEYRILEFDIHRGDVAIVGYGANPNTEASLRASRTRGRDVVHADDVRLLPLL